MFYGLRGTLYVALVVCSSQTTHAEITYLAERLPLQGNRSEPGSPWPIPQRWRSYPLLFTMDPTRFPMESDLKNCDVIEQALYRYRGLLFMNSKVTKDKTLPILPKLFVHISGKICATYPKQDSDEQYELRVGKEGCFITAREVWGVLRGLETFSQLIFTQDNAYRINSTHIRDWPRFQYRGLLVDTARHYIRVSIILKVLEAMSYNKLNAFHWHLVDTQAFPYVSKKFPDLSKKGAYSSAHVYTQADVARVIEFGRLRGIRVIPEFDTPGHTQSWGKAFPDLLTPCWVNNTPYREVYGRRGHARSEFFNPTKNRTFEFLKEFFTEIIEVFKDEFVDLGMDEVLYYCWKSNPNIANFMKQKGFGVNDYSKVEQYYDSRLIDIVQALGAKVYIYQDPIENGVRVNKSAIVRIWKGNSDWKKYAYKVTKLGYRVIISSCYYLNFISYGPDWKQYYKCDPQRFKGTQKQKDNVVGGEASMWSEYVDSTNLLSRLWPRASAVAERLWSRADVNDTDSAAFRLDEHRCRMRSRGIPAEPILPGHCGDLDLDPNPTHAVSVTIKGATSSHEAGSHLSLLYFILWTLSISLFLLALKKRFFNLLRRLCRRFF